jgi:pyruvate/2-oxoglutarate dehydrogenase complex dihydrolipoamide acyltransferase (E2) component
MSTTSDAVAVEVPDIGDFEDVPIIEILVSDGDTVAVDDPLLTLESDKATMDVPAPMAGTVRELLVKVGDRVSQGSKLLTVTLAPAVSLRPLGPRPPTRSRARRRRRSRPRHPPLRRRRRRSHAPRSPRPLLLRPLTAGVPSTPAPPSGESLGNSASTCTR